MSATATPIPPSQFALAIKDLPLPNLHFKAAEIRNQIAHLASSNAQLAEFADDVDCKEAIAENEVVMGRMVERLDLLKAEVEGRGNLWIEDGEEKEKEEKAVLNGAATGEATSNGDIATNGVSSQAQAQSAQSGRLTDEELRAMLRARMEDPAGEDEAGVFL
ncbi:hypothetical protein BLS_004854 [Venturia inaequalis]|uniref:Uncharacterized protein n=1 Tax=Venturia inaequalis TaxID=5025 RepID=A0A8H3UJH9_VENIN|nr:hypothetical protein BLS_004854 [Venturia inaequalis]KAE9994266.1 hypothetical protein EG327_000111 [Venturia inaequalis]